MPTRIIGRAVYPRNKNDLWALNVFSRFLSQGLQLYKIEDGHECAAFGFWLVSAGELSTHSIDFMIYRLHRMNAITRKQRKEMRLGAKQGLREAVRLGEGEGNERKLHIIWS